jgi:HEAT repeat protein
MMDDRPRAVLRDLVSRYGSALGADPLRTEGLLRDTCGSCPREIFVLVNAVRQKVPADLQAPRHTLPLDLLEEFLAKRLCDELSLSEEASRWAVRSWAEALGLDPSPIPEVRKNDTGPCRSAESAPAPVDPGLLTGRDQRAAALESLNLETRLGAVADLSRQPSPENVRLLIAALENGNWQVRAGAFEGLARAGDAAVPLLCEALGDTHDQIVWRATLVLGALKAREATRQIGLLLDRPGIIRECAIWSLGEIGDEGAAVMLTRFVNSDDPVLRHETEAALVKIGKTRPENRS